MKRAHRRLHPFLWLGVSMVVAYGVVALAPAPPAADALAAANRAAPADIFGETP